MNAPTILEQLYSRWAGEPCTAISPIGGGGSSRRYFRMTSATRGCMGAIGTDVRENEAFFAIGRQLLDRGVRVPEVYSVADDRTAYLQQDLGDTTLYGLLHDKRRAGGGFDAEMLSLYTRVLSDLRKIQLAGRDMDFAQAYPRPLFDRRSILWDLNYFKYNFLKLAHIPFDEECLEDDFQCFADLLLQADCSYLLYRDFQTRNIMLHNGELYYIDFQGARQGASQYDVASLLYSAKSDLPQPMRDQLLENYLSLLGSKAERTEWMRHYGAYVLLRIMQTLGAYGYRGLYEQKTYFRESIPLAVRNLRTVIESYALPIQLPELMRTLHVIADTQAAAQAADDGRLSVEVTSFSYKRGLPDDPSGNGGGFVFDCRALPNPGRYEQYKAYTGLDASVQEFLGREHMVDTFIQLSLALVAQSIGIYLERHFTHLAVAYGCTGGQHRSVYCAEMAARRLRQLFPQCNIVVHHREIE